MRGDLAKVSGVTEIETDIKTTICKFKLDDPKLDIKAKLDELAKTNDHIAGWTFLKEPQTN